ncbi:ATP-grasp domain-containing protein [Streptomyces caniferus]|uniref:ATP-grasp domain-containing protein n=1 Tax=Streptomyces caniferus TaxID=285557 RepID=UPI0037FCC29D
MSQNERLALIIGADLYLIRACLRNSIKPVVVHGPGLHDWGFIEIPSEVETVFAEDTSSVESVLFSLHRAGLADREFICIHTGDEKALVTVAALAKVLGISVAVDTDVALRFRDKWLQKKTLSEAGIEVAKFHLIEDVYHPDLAGIADFDKAVLKPIAGAGARNTSVVQGREELIAKCAEYSRSGMPQRTFVLEEFMPGDEWIVDGVVFDGELRFFSVSTYGEPCLSTVELNRALQVEVLDPIIDAGVYELARSVAENTLQTLGLHRGVFHMELFYQAETGKLVFGECAARTGGILQPEIVEAKFGVDLAVAAICCAAGIDPQIEPSIRPDTVGSTYLNNRPGILVGYPSPAEVRALPGVEYLRLELPYGFRMADALASTTEAVGSVVLSGSTKEEFRSRRDFLAQWFDERLVVVPAHATNRELREWQRANWPDSVSSFSTYSDD